MYTMTDRDIQEIKDKVCAMKKDIEFIKTRLKNFESDTIDISKAIQRIEIRHRGNL